MRLLNAIIFLFFASSAFGAEASYTGSVKARRINVRSLAAFIATGGDKTTDGAFTVHTFNGSGTFEPNGSVDVEVLVVGAGGGSLGGGAGGGGGGGGEVVPDSSVAVTTAPVTVTIGAGVSGGTGNSSLFGSITATGGTAGANNFGTGGTSGNSFAGGIGSDNGGACDTTLSRLGGGGGGDSETGDAAVLSTNGGDGGDGVQSSISGTPIFYGGGGGGGGERDPAGAGGQGGGGAGGFGSGGATGTNGTANTGGGSGGGGGLCNVIGTSASTGGSGIVIVRYLTATNFLSSIINTESGGLKLRDGASTEDGVMAFDIDDEDLSIGDGSSSQIIHMGSWKTWTPVFTGFSSDPVVTYARYTIVGKMVTAAMQTGNGTSNATTFTVTLPVAAASAGKQFLTIGQVTNNGAFQTAPGLMKTNTNSATADVFRNGDQGATAWTNAGGKKVNFIVTYESN